MMIDASMKETRRIADPRPELCTEDEHAGVRKGQRCTRASPLCGRAGVYPQSGWTGSANRSPHGHGVGMRHARKSASH